VSTSKHLYALAYARYGFRVFPCHEIESDGFCSCGATACKSPGKHPRIKDWPQLATIAEAQIAQWWLHWSNANIGVACGERSNLTVLDVDPRKGGDASLAELEAEHGDLPLTPLVITGWGGSHYYFAFEPGLSNAASSLAPGLDIRTEGGLVVGVGSKTKDEYRWELSATISDDPAAPLFPVCMPRWLVELIKHQTNKQSANGHFELPPKIKDGARNDTLYRLARSSRKRGQSFAATLAAVEIENRDRCEPPLASDEVQKIVTNAYQQPDRADFKAPSGNPDVERLAALPPLEYDKLRKSEAKRLGVRVDTIDAEVAKARKQNEAGHLRQEAPQWAPAPQVWDQQVKGAELLAELAAAIQRFVMLDQTDALIVGLWILFTWLFEHIAETNPYLRIVSPTPECGKSTLLKVIKSLARGGCLFPRLPQAHSTRTMERERRSLLLDEADAFLHENEIMRNVLDAASDPDTANLSMSVKSGDDWIRAEFNVFVPIAIASIGMLRKMGTVESRSIHIHLKRATRAELKQLSKGRRREMKAVLAPLATKCARWAADNAEALKGARPEFPDRMSGRDMDKWEPLIAIADAIGGDYAKLARAAAAGATKDGHHAGDSLSELLLADLKALFDTSKAKALASADICKTLIELEDRPWGEMGKTRKPLTQRGLAALLRGFGVTSGTVQLDDKSTAKGYKRNDLEDSFSRYLHTSPDPNRQNVNTTGAVGETSDFQNVNGDRSDGLKKDTSTHGENDFDVLTDRNPPDGHEHREPAVEDHGIDRLARADSDDDEGTEL
jgi:hypothetical protein